MTMKQPTKRIKEYEKEEQTSNDLSIIIFSLHLIQACWLSLL